MIAATLHGPNYAWTPNNDAYSIEVFNTLEDVIIALLERHHANGRTSMSYSLLDGRQCIALFPVFNEGTTFTCYEVAGALVQNIASEDQVMDALTDVHSGVWTWRLTLTDTDGTMTVTVEANR